MPVNGTRSARDKELGGSACEGKQFCSGGHGNKHPESTKMGVKAAMVAEEMADSDRVELLAKKKAELERVYESHDALVREMFHMDYFINMVGYNPIEAKKDETQVFRDYKMTYDLVEKAVPSSSRTTRRSRTEQVQALTVTPAFAPQPRTPKKTPKSKSITESKLSEKALSPGKVPASEKRTRIFDDGSLPSSISSSVLVCQQPGGADKEAVPRTFPALRKRKLSEAFVPDVGERSPRPKRQIPGTSNSAIGVHRLNRNQAGTLPPDQQAKPTTLSTSLVPRFNIKRIKLLVRRPQFPITNPLQRPSPAKHNSSVKEFLYSYFTVDHQDVGESAVVSRVQAEADILERADRLRRRGIIFPDSDAFMSVVDLEHPEISLTPMRVSRDHWDQVVEIVCCTANIWMKRNLGQQVTGQISKMIRSYWDGQEAKKEKLKAQEERRLRALAKATMRMVTDEWKKAVFHIREQEQLKLEAEEMRRGREHLDAILDQSGQLLETQHGDLSRGEFPRSRSGSMPLVFQDWASDENEDDGDSDSTGETSEVETAILNNEVTEPSEDEAQTEQSGDEGFSYLDDGEIASDADEGSTSMLLASSDIPQTTVNAHSSVDFEKTAVSDTQSYDDGRPINGSPAPSLDSSSSCLGHSPIIEPKQLEEQPDLTKRIEPVSLDIAVTPPPPVILDSHSAEEYDMSRELLDTSPQSASFRTPVIFDGRSQEFPSSTHSYYSSSPTSPSLSLAASPRPTTTLHVNGDLDMKAPESPAKEPEESQDSEDNTENGLQAPLELQAEDITVPEYLKPFAVAPVEWSPEAKILPPVLLRGILRPYQQSGLEWLASLHVNNLNGILADEMGLGKTIQTIALLAHLACDRGIWGPHLIVVPTSVLLNWAMEFKKFLPGFRVVSYHGSTKRRKELRQGWNDKHHFNVCITSYTLASRDAHIFKRKAWYYMILDEAHMIKNFKSQRWNTLLMFRSFRRLLLTGTPLQNNLTELWALLQFLMSGANFASLKDFGDWFSNPVEKAIEMGNANDDDTMQRVTKLHTVLRPYLLRRLKRDVEKELPSKYEHLVICPLSKRQRFLYDEFMSRAHTRDALHSGIYQKIANVLMQLRKVCNHPDLFEVRPIITSFAMNQSAVADFEIKELLVRRRLFQNSDSLDLGHLGLRLIDNQDSPLLTALETRRLDATSFLPYAGEKAGEPPPKDLRTITGFRKYSAYLERANTIARWTHVGYINRLRCSMSPIYSSELLTVLGSMHKPLMPTSFIETRSSSWETSRLANSMVKGYDTRASELSSVIDKFAFVTPAVVNRGLPRLVLSGGEEALSHTTTAFDSVLHMASVKLQIAFPDLSLLQYDCGKLQELTSLLREKKAGGHRVLIFTQMTRILDILEIFLNFHGYLYLRLDGATKIEDRQYITERFNADSRIFCFIASSRSGGVGINLTGADTVIFYDSDFNPQMDRQCEDRAHRIGQIRDVHIYRFVSQYTVEEALLRKANQKRSLDELVIQKGEFDWRTLFNDKGALSKALEEFEDTEDAHAAAIATTEEVAMQGADEADFGDFGGGRDTQDGPDSPPHTIEEPGHEPDLDNNDEDGGTVTDYMITFVLRDADYFKDWRL